MLSDYVRKYRLHTFVAWLMLLCFVTGQSIVFSHRHPPVQKSFYTLKHTPQQQTISKKCELCDMMHYLQLFISVLVTPSLLLSACRIQNSRQHDYKGIALILSAGRAPPVFPSFY